MSNKYYILESLHLLIFLLLLVTVVPSTSVAFWVLLVTWLLATRIDNSFIKWFGAGNWKRTAVAFIYGWSVGMLIVMSGPVPFVWFVLLAFVWALAPLTNKAIEAVCQNEEK